MKSAYGDWLKSNFQAGTRTTQLSQARRIEEIYGNLDEHFDRDKFASVLNELKYSSADKESNRPNPSRIQIQGEKLYESLAHLRSALGYYGRFRVAEGAAAAPTGAWPELEAMRITFLSRCPDFVNFEQAAGLYHDTERVYKDALIKEAKAIMAHGGSPEVIGDRFFDLLDPKNSNFVGWRTFAQIQAAGPGAVKGARLALGEMLTSLGDVAESVATAANRIHPLLARVPEAGSAYGQIRCLVTAALALARPAEAICIKTRFMQRAAKALTGKAVFKAGVITADEYRAFLALAERIRRMMTNWNWKPRDLWDVQGFLWVVTDDGWRAESQGAQSDHDGDDEGEESRVPTNRVHPLNRILYGPPGTGKTWNTSRFAVEICTGDASDDREELMRRYDELVKAGRVVFTTFHQSMGYEDFVEGLRPTTDDREDGSSSAGFHLEAQPGIFRNLCAVAEQARNRGGRSGSYDFSGRQFFKMSLGRAWTEGHIYDAAIKGNYIVLGWGGDLDWSDPKYEDYRAVYDRWRAQEPNAGGNSGNISQVWCFRSSIRNGDIVIVSEGNLRFRAIGEVVGDYKFELGGDGGNHRRTVKWLAVLKESLPIETVYDGKLSQVSCYQLDRSRLKLDALEAQVAPSFSAANRPPNSYVLIIDEINRANISKVFGELITLMEPDKRLGESNALTAKLPYSNDEFGIPNNLYIVGTMNTADRSVALIDTALRRRFDFTEMMPDYECLNRAIGEIHLGDLLRAINRRVEWLFDRDHQLGHAFFVRVDCKSTLDQVMRTKIIPLLAEYFYEDWGKVRAALNDSEGWFIETETLAAPKHLQGEAEERLRYTIRKGEIPVEGYAAAGDQG